MKPAAPNSMQWRITARSSFPETTTTGVEGRSERRNRSPEKPRTPGMVKSSSTRSVSGEASSAAAMLSKSCATLDLGVWRRGEHRLAQPADDEWMVIGNEHAKGGSLRSSFPPARPARQSLILTVVVTP